MKQGVHHFDPERDDMDRFDLALSVVKGFGYKKVSIIGVPHTRAMRLVELLSRHIPYFATDSETPFVVDEPSWLTYDPYLKGHIYHPYYTPDLVILLNRYKKPLTREERIAFIISSRQVRHQSKFPYLSI